MRRPGVITTFFVVFTLIIATFVFLDPILRMPIQITQENEDTFVINESGQLLNAESNTQRLKTSKTKEIKIEFNAYQLNSTLPTLSQLYPGGFVSPGVPRCTEEDNIKLLVVIHSAPTHVDRRHAIRSSWAAPIELPLGVRVVFLIGEGGERDPYLEPTNDVIVARFTDTYRNLTLKSVAMLDWTMQNCPNVAYLLKCDDDVYVNIIKLFIELEMDFKQKNSIIGKIAHAWKPIRNTKSKYYISYEEFAPSILPNFTTGPAYLVEGSTIGPLLNAALDEPWLSLEDVFLTGLVAGVRMGSNLIHWPSFLNNRATMTVCNAQQLIAIHNVKPKEQSKLVNLSKLSGRSCPLRDLRIKNSKKINNRIKKKAKNY